MPEFGMRRLSHALAVIVLAVAACLAGGVQAHAASNFSLVILPDQGENAIYNFVNSATSSVNVTIYELKDTTLVNDLVAREAAGVKVRVIMDQAHQSYDAAAYSALTAGGVGVVWSSTAFTYTHQKTITVDGDESYISTGNFDTTYYATSRDYGVFDTDPSDVAAIIAVFNADYAHSSITPSDGDDLVWSPTDSQTRLLALINGATKSLDIEQEEFSDTALINALVSALNRGVTVRVVLEDPSSYSSEVTEIKNAGGTVTGYSSSTGFYIHAKTIIADYGTSAAKAFAGSENFSSNSLGNNRELGLITADSGVVSGLESTFTADFTGSSAGKVAIINPGTQTTAAGASAYLQVQAIDTATGSLSYSGTGLPAGLSIASSTGVISGTASTAGTYTVTVTGKDSTGVSGSATFTWTVGSGSGSGTGTCTAAQLLGNPGFETGVAAPWTTTSGVISDSSAEPPHSGTWDAWLDGTGKTTTDTLAQAVTVPAGCGSYQFSFWLHINTAETSTTKAYDTLSVQVLNSSGTVLGTLATFSNLNAATGYVQHTYSLSAYAGQTVTLKFTGAEDYVYQTSFVVDDTALNVS
ncbi:MAG TPA: phospholipase D-like domain-containing protein [Trebonia sp.]|nr:phospholipase D-like domain-containing protein [Trebonia sp.]